MRVRMSGRSGTEVVAIVGYDGRGGEPQIFEQYLSTGWVALTLQAVRQIGGRGEKIRHQQLDGIWTA